MDQAQRDSKARFSDRVDDYLKYRPHYSPEVLLALAGACGLQPDHLVADIGCGTGLLAEIFLEHGNRVIGVEPNREMRLAGEAYLADYHDFVMIEGSAEATNLGPSSVDFVAAGQAFHWFRVEQTRAEFARVVKPRGWIVLVWHDRDTESTNFLRAYETFIRRHATDYDRVQHKYIASYEALEAFFAPNQMDVITQHNQQGLDFDGLSGRLLSSSYIPKDGERYQAMMHALPELFSTYCRDNKVLLEYNTRIYYGHLDR
jgi:SAM-dependent methyltransferase